MTNATENQIIDNAEATAPTVAKKKGAVALLKKRALFEAPDGTIFETQKEATEYLRRHLKVDAVNAVAALFTGVDAEGNEQTLGQFLLSNEDAIRKAYDAAKVERAPVTEETKAKMRAARAKLKGEVAPADQTPADAETQGDAQAE